MKSKIISKNQDSRTHQQITEFLELLKEISRDEKIRWFNGWIRPEIEKSEIQSEKMLVGLRERVAEIHSKTLDIF